LKTFDDLTSIGTYGFRGEALASISHIAHLTVTTRTQESSCAWRAQYADGKLVPQKAGQDAEPKPIAGRQGTQITVRMPISSFLRHFADSHQVEDLFYNVPTRRRAFRSASEEYAKILEVVGKYAVHRKGVAFSCKKHGDSSMGVSVQINASTIDRIRQIHGSAVANELIEVKAESERWGFTANGYVSNANYSVKRTTNLLFINHRSVESSAIKKAVEQTYSAFLPKGGHPFIYLSLEIEPARVDVNVHPTKREVNFLHEEEIIGTICDQIREVLGKVDTSRTFMTQSLLPGGKVPMAKIGTPDGAKNSPVPSARDSGATQKSQAKSTTQKPYENNLVRTDARARKITTMLSLTQQPTSDGAAAPEKETRIQYEHTDKEPTSVRLTTVKELRAEVRESMHGELTDVFSTHTFVGIVDERRRMATIQSGVKLFLVDYAMVCNEYFYQVGLTDFGNFGSIRFDPPLDLKELLYLAAAQESTKNEKNAKLDWDEVVTVVSNQIISRRDMLEEYFALEVSEDGKLLAIPLLVKDYQPSMAKLPSFLLRLGPHINWMEEKPCFHTFLKELAIFYVPESLPPPPTSATSDDDTVVVEEDAEIAARRKHINRTLENVLFPAFKARLIATKAILKGVVEVANLKGLYRVFERC
jgi:DNA mismatch repair protein MLH1